MNKDQLQIIRTLITGNLKRNNIPVEFNLSCIYYYSGVGSDKKGEIIIEETENKSVLPYLDLILIMLQEISVNLSKWKIIHIEYAKDKEREGKKYEVIVKEFINLPNFYIQEIKD